MSDVFDIGIIGMGPAGIGMAMSLRDTSKIMNTVCFERGNYSGGINCSVLLQKECHYSKVCGVISGVGGASTLSSGKISNFPAGSGLVEFFDSEDHLIDNLDNIIIPYLTDKIGLKKVKIDAKRKEYAKLFYKQRGILYKYYDVYEFDGESYRNFIQETVEELRNDGLQIFEDSEVLDINHDPNTLCFSINVRTPDGEKLFYVRKLVLATGALDIQDRLVEKLIGKTADAYEIGLRIETPSSAFGNILSTHGDMKLKFDAGRTFCVTVDGIIIAYHTDGMFFLEGCMEQSLPTAYTNLAVLIKCNDKEVLYDFINRYRSEFNGTPVKQKFEDYINGENSDEELYTTLSLAICGNINNLFPTDINNAIKRFIKHVLVETMGISEHAISLVAPELKILRNLQIANNFELGRGLYIIGSATGKFRGILQSFCSGIRCGQLLSKGDL